MSNLADKTEKKAIQVLANTLRHFDNLHNLEMTRSDDWDSCEAQNLIYGIIQSNGYRVEIGKRTRLIRDYSIIKQRNID